MILSPEVFGYLSVVFAAIAYPPYLRAMLKGKIKPHVFTWVLWTLLTWIAFAIQVSAGAGPGAWATGFTAFCTTIIAAVSYRYGEKGITRSDWCAFVAGLLTIPLWIWTKDPTASAILVTLIDATGYYPTFRKSWHKPHEEMIYTHFLSNAKHILSLFAMPVINIPTAFYPIMLVVMNTLLAGMLYWRRLKETKI